MSPTAAVGAILSPALTDAGETNQIPPWVGLLLDALNSNNTIQYVLAGLAVPGAGVAFYQIYVYAKPLAKYFMRGSGGAAAAVVEQHPLQDVVAHHLPQPGDARVAHAGEGLNGEDHGNPPPQHAPGQPVPAGVHDAADANAGQGAGGVGGDAGAGLHAHDPAAGAH